MHTSLLAPGQDFPSIMLPLLDGEPTDISKPAGQHDWKLILVYRGKHCPLCSLQLAELENTREQFSEIGIDVMAVSADSQARAQAHLAEVDRNYPVAYDLSQLQMKSLGLHISGIQNGTDVERPFAEPGLFIVDQDGKLQMIDVSNVPFSRPNLSSVAAGMKWLRGQEVPFPINGSYV